jgi:hypothetical protein
VGAKDSPPPSNGEGARETGAAGWGGATAGCGTGLPNGDSDAAGTLPNGSPCSAGVGAALATIGTELFTCGMFVWTIGRKVLDRRLLATAGKLFAVCGVVIVLDRICLPLGSARLVLDAAAFCALAVATGAWRVSEVLEFASAARKTRRAESF